MEIKKILHSIGSVVLLSLLVALIMQVIAPESSAGTVVVKQIIFTGLFYPAIHQ